MGRVALVTDGTCGIGAACAIELGRLGADVVVTATTSEALDRGLGDLAEAGVRATGHVTDIHHQPDVNALFDTLLDRYGRCDVLVNNAGKAEQTRDDTIGVNLTGTFRVTARWLKRSGVLERGWGRVVNIDSAPAGHGLVSMTRTLAAELAGTGVTVNAVCPGPVATGHRRVAATVGFLAADPTDGVTGLTWEDPDLRTTFPGGKPSCAGGSPPRNRD